MANQVTVRFTDCNMSAPFPLQPDGTVAVTSIERFAGSALVLHDGVALTSNAAGYSTKTFLPGQDIVVNRA